MVVEVYLKTTNSADSGETLPDSILELEMSHREIQVTLEKLQESTDILMEEFRKAGDNEEAKEYYEYVQDNMHIIKSKTDRLEKITQKINTIKGIFPIIQVKPAGGTMMEQDEGHYI